MPKAVYAAAVAVNNRPQCDSNLGRLTPQLDASTSATVSFACPLPTYSYLRIVFEVELEIVEGRAVVDKPGRVEFGELGAQTVPRQLHREDGRHHLAPLGHLHEPCK